MDFGDTVYATATVVVISVLLFVPMDLVFGLELWFVGRAVSVFIAALIAGLIYAGKLADARIVSIAKVIVLGAIVIMFLTFGILSIATVHDFSSEANPVDTWTTLQWASLMTYTFRQIFFYVVLLDSVAFMGLYAGSMLRKPKKT